MNTYRAVAAVALLAIGAVGCVGGQARSPSASVSPSVSSRPSSSTTAAAPPLTQSFVSTIHGISVSYPEGWTAQAATEQWAPGSVFPLSFQVPQVDWLYDTTLEADLFLAIASQPIGDATPEDWAADQMASDEGCGPVTEPVTVDAASGLIGDPDCSIAVVTTAGRGYWIQLYSGSGAPATGYDRGWFEEVLATVELHPEDAVD